MKYIVDIDDFEPLFKVDSIGVFGIGKSVSDSDNDHSRSRIKSIEEFEELTSDYINEHFGDLQDTAYHRGLEEGSLDVKQRVEGAYQRGLEDAWEAARKIVKMPDPPYWGVFDEYKDDLFRKITAAEAIEKLKAYEKKQKADNDIKVGDEVVIKHSGIKGILLEPETEFVLAKIIVPSQRWRTFNASHVNLKKTGKYYDIEKLLEVMKA